MSVNGLPLHVLVIHAVVVLVPLTGLVMTLAAVWPAARRRIGVVGPLLALVTTALVPVTTASGEWLQARVADTPLIREHAELGDTMLPYAVGMLVVAVGGWLVHRWWQHSDGQRDRAGESPAGRGGRLAVGIVLAVLTVAVSGAAVWQVYRIGDSGARAVWTGGVSPTPRPDAGR